MDLQEIDIEIKNLKKLEKFNNSFPEFISSEVVNNVNELSKFLAEAFLHYEYYDYKKSLVENVQTLIGLHMNDAIEEYNQRISNTNANFYGKESFKLGNLHIETKK
jgi:hypothetical protein